MGVKDDRDVAVAARSPTSDRKNGVDSHPEDRSDDDDETSPVPNTKSRDPNRPKRKKAHRACAACQRAHLTCSDNRPCERCIQRKIADQCHDGARKKAKYLHDLPNEALDPSNRASFASTHGTTPQATPTKTSIASTDQALDLISPTLSVPMSSTHQIPAPVEFQPTYSAERSTSLPGSFPGGVPQSAPPNVSLQPFPDGIFDGGDSNMFDVDLSSLNFGSQIGALEFGMLGHMMSQPNRNMSDPMGSGDAFVAPHIGAQDFSPVQTTTRSRRFSAQTPVSSNHWSGGATPGSAAFQYGAYQPAQPMFDDGFDPTVVPAFAIAGRTSSFAGASPGSSSFSGDFGMYSAQPHNALFEHGIAQVPERNATALRETQQMSTSSSQQQQQQQQQHLSGTARHHTSTKSRKTHNPSEVYEKVRAPYPYTAAFHALAALFPKRFSKQTTLRIAKALSSIRPSFISLAKSLTYADLIFMEKAFQRQLYDYEDYTERIATPTLLCRRTGEVAHVSSEFSVVTGWSRGVLLGDEPNLNVNAHKPEERGSGSGENGSGVNTTSSSRGGFNTPRIPNETVPSRDGAGVGGGVAGIAGSGVAGTSAVAEPRSNPTFAPPPRKQPVFLTELLDNDSAVKFFDDYARLAFADRKGSSIGRCKLLQYKTKDYLLLERTNKAAADARGVAGASASANDAAASESGQRTTSANAHSRKGVETVASAEDGMQKFGNKDGTIDCMYTWLVKRDMFNMPAMIVINFMPIL